MKCYAKICIKYFKLEIFAKGKVRAYGKLLEKIENLFQILFQIGKNAMEILYLIKNPHKLSFFTYFVCSILWSCGRFFSVAIFTHLLEQIFQPKNAILKLLKKISMQRKWQIFSTFFLFLLVLIKISTKTIEFNGIKAERNSLLLKFSLNLGLKEDLQDRPCLYLFRVAYFSRFGIAFHT